MSRIFNPKMMNLPAATSTTSPRPMKLAWTDCHDTIQKLKSTPRVSPRATPRSTPFKVIPPGQTCPYIPRLNLRDIPTPRDGASKGGDQVTPRYRQHQGGVHQVLVSPGRPVTPLNLRQYPVRELYYAKDSPKDSPKDTVGDSSTRGGDSRSEVHTPRVERFRLRTLSVNKDEENADNNKM